MNVTEGAEQTSIESNSKTSAVSGLIPGSHSFGFTASRGSKCFIGDLTISLH